MNSSAALPHIHIHQAAKMFLQQHLRCKSLQKAFSRVVWLSDDIKFTLLHQHQTLVVFPESIEVMPNGKRGRSGDSQCHTSDSETRVVLKNRRVVLRYRVTSSWKRFVCHKRTIRAAARRIQYVFAPRAPELDIEITYRIAEFVGAQ